MGDGGGGYILLLCHGGGGWAFIISVLILRMVVSSVSPCEFYFRKKKNIFPNKVNKFLYFDLLSSLP